MGYFLLVLLAAVLNNLDLGVQGQDNGGPPAVEQNENVPDSGAAEVSGVRNGTLTLFSCAEDKECISACGSRADDSRCAENLSCLCLNANGPPRRCRNIGRLEEFPCTAACRRRVSQICVTDYGERCACFVRSQH